jgi:hypothetical protein
MSQIFSSSFSYFSFSSTPLFSMESQKNEKIEFTRLARGGGGPRRGGRRAKGREEGMCIRADVSTARPCRTWTCLGHIRLLPLELSRQLLREIASQPNTIIMVYPLVFPRAPSKLLSPRALSKLAHAHAHTRTSHLLPEHVIRVIRLSLYHCPPPKEEEEEDPFH